jgi:uncharacterized membrane protein YdfJ with MMPL/SSD domain
MVSTGHIITCAGVIMAVAFSGLLFSAELALNQTAFLLCGSGACPRANPFNIQRP